MLKKHFYQFYVIGGVCVFVWVILNICWRDFFWGCFVKWLWRVPCPFCGTTRSFLWLFEGKVYEAIYTNPLGLVAGIGGGCFFIWLGVDWMMKRETLFVFYCKVERLLGQKKWMIVFGVLVFLNWLWNIKKGL